MFRVWKSEHDTHFRDRGEEKKRNTNTRDKHARGSRGDAVSQQQQEEEERTRRRKRDDEEDSDNRRRDVEKKKNDDDRKRNLEAEKTVVRDDSDADGRVGDIGQFRL